LYIILINNTFTMSNNESLTGGTITDADTTARKELFTKFIETLAEIIIADNEKRLADNEKRLADEEQPLDDEYYNKLRDTATKNKDKPRTRHVATKDPGIV